MLFWLVFACDGEKIELDDTAGGGDSAANTDDSVTMIDDTGDDTGGDDTGETGGGDATEVSFALEGDWSGLTVAVTQFTFGANDEIVVLDGLASAEASAAEVWVELPTPTELTPYDATVSFGVFAASLHEDGDGDGFPAGEPIVGVARVWLMYLEGGVPSELLGMGLAEGWNAIDLLGGQPARALEGVPLGTNLSLVETALIGGEFDGEFSDTTRLALLPQAQGISSLIYDERLEPGPWSVTVAGAPPPDHLVTDVVTYAIETPLVFEDVDGSGGASEGDMPRFVACDAAGSSALLLWLDPVTDLAAAMQYGVMGYHAGWSAVVSDTDGNTRVLDEAEAWSLDLCPAVF